MWPSVRRELRWARANETFLLLLMRRRSPQMPLSGDSGSSLVSDWRPTSASRASSLSGGALNTDRGRRERAWASWTHRMMLRVRALPICLLDMCHPLDLHW